MKRTFTRIPDEESVNDRFCIFHWCPSATRPNPLQFYFRSISREPHAHKSLSTWSWAAKSPNQNMRTLAFEVDLTISIFDTVILCTWFSMLTISFAQLNWGRRQWLSQTVAMPFTIALSLNVNNRRISRRFPLRSLVMCLRGKNKSPRRRNCRLNQLITSMIAWFIGTNSQMNDFPFLRS